MAKEKNMDTSLLYHLVMVSTQDEFYTYDLPKFDKQMVACINLFKRGVVYEMVMKEKVEEYYQMNMVLTDVQQDTSKFDFDLRDGFAIKVVDPSTLDWLHRSEKEARDLIKDKLLKT